MKERRLALAWMVMVLSPAFQVLGAGDEPLDKLEPVNVCTEHQNRIDAKDRERRERIDKTIESLLAEEKYQEANSGIAEIIDEIEKDSSIVNAQVYVSQMRAAKGAQRKIQKAWSGSLLAKARMCMAEENFEQAIDFANRAAAVYSDCASEANSIAEDCRKTIANRNLDKSIDINTFDKAVPIGKEEVKRLMYEARKLYDAGRYHDAMTKVEQVFVEDPMNYDATYLADRIYAKMYAYGRARRNAEHEAEYTLAEWQWTEPVFPINSVKMNPQQHGSVKVVTKDDNSFDRIIFDHIDFNGVDTVKALNWIEKRSSDFDPNRSGITININGRPARDKITLSLRNVPVGELIKYVCRLSGFKFRMHGAVAEVGMSVEEMEQRLFPAPTNLLSYVGDGEIAETARTESGSSKLTQTSAESGNLGTITTMKRVEPTQEQWIEYFGKRGIGFPEGSKVAYISKSRKLSVYNTPEHLERIGTLLRQLETVDNPPLIMVEIKSIEIGETDYQELGFDWGLYNTYTRGGMLSSAFIGNGAEVYPSGQAILESGQKRGWTFGQGDSTINGGELSMIRNTQTLNNNVNTTIIDKLNIFPVLFGSRYPFGSNIPLNITLTINALDRNDRTEALSAPKVIAKNDTEATVEMIKVYYFPTSWDTLEVEVTGENDSILRVTPPAPTFGQYKIGTIFTVKPKVMSDNRTIRLTLSPEISTYEGDDKWSINLWGQTPTWNKEKDDFEWSPVTSLEVYNIYKPIIGRREMQMDIDLYDGESAVVGGLVNSITTSRTDKMPILGDLPVVGRLFQSQAENAERHNLMFVVTARLLTYDGVPIEHDNVPDVPDFYR